MSEDGMSIKLLLTDLALKKIKFVTGINWKGILCALKDIIQKGLNNVKKSRQWATLYRTVPELLIFLAIRPGTLKIIPEQIHYLKM